MCIQNSPIFQLDSLCTTTDANGYYYLTIPNGSAPGPNIGFTLVLQDPCPFFPSNQTATVENAQGTVNIIDLDWTICAPNGPACDVEMTSSEQANGDWTFVANPTGTAPFTYDWWVNGTTYTTQTVNHTFNGGTVGVSVTVTDANGCESTEMDTLYLDGNNACDVQIGYLLDPILGGSILTAYPSGVAPFTYLWSTGETTESIYPAEPLQGTYCVTSIDDNGCESNSCYTFPNSNCSVEITTTVDSVAGGVVYTLTASQGFTSYVWFNGATTQSITVSNVSPNGEVHCVTATDQSGCTATACDTLLPPNTGGCYADFTYNAGPNGVLYAIDTVGLFYNGSMSASNSYLWTLEVMNFSFTSTDMNPSFVVPPTLIPITGVDVQICVTVTDAATGCTDTYCEWVTVVGGNSLPCEAAFLAEESNILGIPLPAVQFTDISTDASSWYWDFGDNSTSTEQNPLHAI